MENRALKIKKKNRLVFRVGAGYLEDGGYYVT
jgi:hypothetical protein